MTILLVEDNQDNQKIGLLQLRMLGYHAEAVSNGRDALAAVALHSYALILMDCRMPSMSGFEVTSVIRQQEIGIGKHVPIIALTALSDREHCLAIGMDDYLCQPVETQALRTKIDQWMVPSTADFA